MSIRAMMVPIGKIDVSKYQMRASYTPAGRRKLAGSIKTVGVLVPVILYEVSPGSYALIDGGTRLSIVREQSSSDSVKIPAIIVDTDENGALAAGVVINQMRERLSQISELRALVKLHQNGLSEKEAAKLLGKTQSWASKRMSISRLPSRVRKHLGNERMTVSQAIVMAPFAKEPAILDMLLPHALSGKISVRDLQRMADTAKADGIPAGESKAPHTHKAGSKSWVRIEHFNTGVRAEIHLHNEDDIEKILVSTRRLLKKARKG